MSDLVCISHLTWTEAERYSRYLPSRLARQHRVLFIEAPRGQPGITSPQLETTVVDDSIARQVSVIRPVFPCEDPSDLQHDEVIRDGTYVKLLHACLDSHRFDSPTLWLSTPLAAGYADLIPHRLLVYEALSRAHERENDEERYEVLERALLTRANLVIYRSRIVPSRQKYSAPTPGMS